MTCDYGGESRRQASVDRRAAAFARLFQAVHEGVYIGTIGPDGTSTLAANPHLKVIFGYLGETPDADVRPLNATSLVGLLLNRRASPLTDVFA